MRKKYNISYINLYKACLNALKRLAITIEYTDKNEGLIKGFTKASMLSWGENITIRLNRIDDHQTEIDIKSNVSSQLFSWGKDSMNENNIITEIEKII